MPRETKWKDLKVGIVAAIALAALVGSIFLFAQVGAIRGKKFQLHVLTGDATGVLKGTEVWLSGQKIGLVTTVDYLQTSVPIADRIVVNTEIRAEEFPLIRRNSKVEIRPGGNLIGSPVVMITGGTASSPPVQDGDTLNAAEDVKIEGMMTSVHKVESEVSALGADLSKAMTQLKSPRGTTGAFLQNGMPALSATSAQFSQMMSKMTSGRGTIGLATRNGLFGKASSIMSSVDSLRTMLASGEGNVGRFRRDSTLGPQVKGLMAQVDSLRALAADPAGNIGRARSDSTLSTELARARRELDALMKDIKKHPLRYIAF
jgi:phospholipid/cholesterol/gamma-HCH transport system substrate-binding protein